MAPNYAVPACVKVRVENRRILRSGLTTPVSRSRGRMGKFYRNTEHAE